MYLYIINTGDNAMTADQFQDACRLYSNETLRAEADRKGARGFYARAELARRDFDVGHG